MEFLILDFKGHCTNSYKSLFTLNNMGGWHKNLYFIKSCLILFKLSGIDKDLLLINSSRLRKFLIYISGKQKRVRMTSTSSLEEIKPFENLQSLDIYLKSPTHMPIFQLLVSLSKNLESLIFDQFYCDYEESLINRTLFEWNSLKTLKNLTIGHGSRLSIVTVNGRISDFQSP